MPARQRDSKQRAADTFSWSTGPIAPRLVLRSTMSCPASIFSLRMRLLVRHPRLSTDLAFGRSIVSLLMRHIAAHHRSAVNLVRSTKRTQYSGPHACPGHGPHLAGLRGEAEVIAGEAPLPECRALCPRCTKARPARIRKQTLISGYGAIFRFWRNAGFGFARRVNCLRATPPW